MADGKLIAPDFSAIEAAGLHGIGNHWCAWKLVARESGKPSKIPYGRSGAISSQAPETWLTYDDAKALYEGGGFAGIGYLNQPSDGIVCLDADGVLDREHMVVLDSGAEIVAQLRALGCYLEKSPSGTGLRGFIRGHKSGEAKARTTIFGHSVEVYQPTPGGEKAQYVTITGAYIGALRSPDAGPEGQWRLDRFLKWSGLEKNPSVDVPPTPENTVAWRRRSDDAVVQLLRVSLNLKGKLNRVWAGDVRDFGGQSEARAALLSQLCYISRDAEQIDRIMRRTALDHKRFDEKRSGGTFLQYEVGRALKRQRRSYDADRGMK